MSFLLSFCIEVYEMGVRDILSSPAALYVRVKNDPTQAVKQIHDV